MNGSSPAPPPAYPADLERVWQAADGTAVVVAMTMLSALGGIWVSRTVVAPVAQLAAKVRHRSPNDWEHPLADDFPVGEVGELARVFDRHLVRMRAFMERERVFSADMSHELRTALAVILSATEILLEDETLGEKPKTRVMRIKRAANDMAELGTALLLMAREEYSISAAGGGCVVADAVREVVTEQRHLLHDKPVELTVQTNPELRTILSRMGVYLSHHNEQNSSPIS